MSSIWIPSGFADVIIRAATGGSCLSIVNIKLAGFTYRWGQIVLMRTLAKQSWWESVVGNNGQLKRIDTTCFQSSGLTLISLVVQAFNLRMVFKILWWKNENYRMGQVGRDHLLQPSCSSRPILEHIASRKFLRISRERDSTTCSSAVFYSHSKKKK